MANAAAVTGGAVGTVHWTLQRRYDVAYAQCMYAKGNQVPVPRGWQPTWPTPQPRRRSALDGIPPLPAGMPPAPPLGR